MPQNRQSNSILMKKIDSELRAASNRVRFTVQSGQLVHTTTDFHDLSPFLTTYQILIESKSFPRSWERAVIIKDFFQIFGEVTGVNILAGNRFIVNFKEDLAARMTSSMVQVRALLSLQVPWDRQPCLSPGDLLPTPRPATSSSPSPPP